MVEMRNTHTILFAKPEGEKPLGIKRRRKWDNNINMSVKQTGIWFGGVAWIQVL
jgi:hypothetical protein